jgi:tRNA pseudouridine38-40 synthase
VQGALEEAVLAVAGERCAVVASGRTDAGANALSQVVAFSTASRLSSEVICQALNAHLPDDIAVTAAEDVDVAFHPRFDASSRVYRYVIWNRPVRSPFWAGRSAHVRHPLNERAMNEAAECLIGLHDFGAFAPARHMTGYERTMYRARCWREADLVQVELEASGFLRQMVRAIVGTLVRVGRGVMDITDFDDVLKSADRARAGDTMPGCGLYLIGPKYSSPGPLPYEPLDELMVAGIHQPGRSEE